MRRAGGPMVRRLRAALLCDGCALCSGGAGCLFGWNSNLSVPCGCRRAGVGGSVGVHVYVHTRTETITHTQKVGRTGHLGCAVLSDTHSRMKVTLELRAGGGGGRRAQLCCQRPPTPVQHPPPPLPVENPHMKHLLLL